MDIDTLGTALGGVSLVAWGALTIMVKTLWESRRNVEVACDKVDTMWRCLIEPAIRDGFLRRESPLHLTDKGRELLSGEPMGVINYFLDQEELQKSRHPVIEILNHNYVAHCLVQLAADKHVQEGIVFAVAETYIEERLQSLPKRAKSGNLLLRPLKRLGGMFR
jgi:hypothetical protein